MSDMNEIKAMLRKMVEDKHAKFKEENPDIRDLGEHELTVHRPGDKTSAASPMSRMMSLRAKASAEQKSRWDENYAFTTEGVIHGKEIKVDSSLYGEIPVKQFLGVPYAKPPIGELRFRKAEKPFKHFGVRECQSFTAGAMQLSGIVDDPFADPGYNGTYYEEDCLYCNIWSPARKLDEKVPTVVWIHGGGMVNSTAMADFRTAQFLAAHGVLVICINYRLGFFGFFAHPELEDENGSCGNYALYDMKQAVEWARDNAEAFGGDPENITVGGQSGGAMAANLLFVSPLMEGLVKRYIIQSGACFHGMMQPIPKEQAEKNGEEFLKRHGISSLEELRKMDPTEIIRLTEQERFVPNCIVDGTFIAEMPQDTLLDGRMNRADVLVTATAREFAAHLDENTISTERFEEYVRDTFGEKAAGLLELYPHSDSLEAGKSYYSLLGDLHFIGVIRTCEECAKHGLNAYAGYFTRPVAGEDGDLVGAIHSSELPYLFGRVNHGGKTQLGYIKWSSADHRHAEMLDDMWTNFMRAGNPGFRWKRFEERFDVMNLGEKKEMLSGSDIERLSFVYDIISGDKYATVGDFLCPGIRLM